MTSGLRFRSPRKAAAVIASVILVAVCIGIHFLGGLSLPGDRTRPSAPSEPMKELQTPKVLQHDTSLLEATYRRNLTTTSTMTSTTTITTTITTTSTTRKRDCGEPQFLTSDVDLQVFKPAVTGNDLCLLMDTLEALSGALTKANITYFLYSGTLLGSWRHHGLVPWDDDVDIAVDFTHQRELRRAFDTLKPTFTYTERGKVMWKFYAEAANVINGYSWRWPFVDVCFFEESSTQVFDHDLLNVRNFFYPKAWVFPLVLRPFGKLLLPAPRRTKEVLDKTYDVERCEIGHYNHRKEMGKSSSEVGTVDCDDLVTVYPFVEHVPLGADSCNETLVLNGTVLSWLRVNGLQC